MSDGLPEQTPRPEGGEGWSASPGAATPDQEAGAGTRPAPGLVGLTFGEMGEEEEAVSALVCASDQAAGSALMMRRSYAVAALTVGVLGIGIVPAALNGTDPTLWFLPVVLLFTAVVLLILYLVHSPPRLTCLTKGWRCYHIIAGPKGFRIADLRREREKVVVPMVRADPEEVAPALAQRPTGEVAEERRLVEAIRGLRRWAESVPRQVIETPILSASRVLCREVLQFASARTTSRQVDARMALPDRPQGPSLAEIIAQSDALEETYAARCPELDQLAKDVSERSSQAVAAVEELAGSPHEEGAEALSLTSAPEDSDFLEAARNELRGAFETVIESLEAEIADQTNEARLSSERELGEVSNLYARRLAEVEARWGIQIAELTAQHTKCEGALARLRLRLDEKEQALQSTCEELREVEQSEETVRESTLRRLRNRRDELERQVKRLRREFQGLERQRERWVREREEAEQSRDAERARLEREKQERGSAIKAAAEAALSTLTEHIREKREALEAALKLMAQEEGGDGMLVDPPSAMAVEAAAARAILDYRRQRVKQISQEATASLERLLEEMREAQRTLVGQHVPEESASFLKGHDRLLVPFWYYEYQSGTRPSSFGVLTPGNLVHRTGWTRLTSLAHDPGDFPRLQKEIEDDVASDEGAKTLLRSGSLLNSPASRRALLSRCQQLAARRRVRASLHRYLARCLK